WVGAGGRAEGRDGKTEGRNESESRKGVPLASFRGGAVERRALRAGGGRPLDQKAVHEVAPSPPLAGPAPASSIGLPPPRASLRGGGGSARRGNRVVGRSATAIAILPRKSAGSPTGIIPRRRRRVAGSPRLMWTAFDQKAVHDAPPSPPLAGTAPASGRTPGLEGEQYGDDS